MLRNFLKNKKAQNTAEYALLIALVVAGIIAMQTYAQRALQERIHAVGEYMATADSDNGAIENKTQYEPYYLQSSYNVQSNSVDNKRLGQGLDGFDSASNRTTTGNQVTTYNDADNSM